jgi:hypothetical protein
MIITKPQGQRGDWPKRCVACKADRLRIQWRDQKRRRAEKYGIRCPGGNVPVNPLARRYATRANWLAHQGAA